jgi:ABC-type uncharacterized transport system substrate-binding protein
MLLVVFSSTAQAFQVAVVSHKPLASIERLVQATAEQTGARVSSVVWDKAIDWKIYDAVVLAGPKAVELWQPAGTPAVAVFVSRIVTEQAKIKLASAVYIEPPLSRQIALAKAILGNDRSMGILAQNAQSLSLARFAGQPLSAFNVTPYFVDQYDSLNRALADLLKKNQALIGVYDLELFSSANIKNILITAYRQNKPLIGPSSAYIKAGALATTYSDLDDVARRLSQILLTGVKEGVWPAADYNPYFHVRYNEQVGRSLNLVLPQEAQLRQMISELEATP